MHKVEGPTLALRRYDIIFVNTSGGKDSQAMMARLVHLAEAAGVQDRLVAVHADLGEVEWPGTRELAQKQAEHFNIPFHVAERKGTKLPETLLGYVEHRKAWPDSQTRYCTSEFKRAPCSSVMTRLVKEWKEATGETRQCFVLNCFGFRAEESPRRKKIPVFQKNKRQSNKTMRHVDDWLPIHPWTTEQVWDTIRESGAPHHWAYDRGMTRLSCRFCIFSPRSQLLLAASMPENKELFQTYVQLENKIGHTFRKNQSLQEIHDAIEAGEKPVKEDDGCWNM